MKPKEDKIFQSLFIFLVVLFPISFLIVGIGFVVNPVLSVFVLMVLQTFWTIIAMDYILLRKGVKTNAVRSVIEK